MLLKLIPAHSEPTIHFSFAFADLPSNVNTPPSWSNQLSHLIVEDLEVPTTVHSFDKAAGLTSLLEEVAFDIERGEVRCRFVDGGVEEWGFFRCGDIESGVTTGFEAGQMEGQKLISALECIMRDVKESTFEDDRAVMERERERQKIVGVERSKSMGFRGPHKGPKHKKQRSVFMQLVSSIGSSLANLTSSSPSGPALPSHRFSPSLSTSSSYPTHHSPNGPHNPPPHLPGTSPRARALRRAARSALVDTYRRFVLTELTKRLLAFSYKDALGQYTRVHGGGFCVWILHSMRRRAQERIEQLLEEAEVIMAERAKERGLPLTRLSIPGGDGRTIQWAPAPSRPSEDGKDGFEATTMVVPLSFSDDEDDTETETDGSSVHTPSSSSHLAYFPVRPPTSASSHSQASLTSQFHGKDLPTTPSPPSSPTTPSFQSEDLTPTRPFLQSRPTTLSQNLTGSALYEYSTLVDLRERLWQLAMFAESQARIASDEIKNRLEILAVRSRRRAWSAGALKMSKDHSAGMGQYGLAMPFRSSPLARYSWTAEDLQKEQEKADASVSQNSIIGSNSISVTSFPVYGKLEDDGLEHDGPNCPPLEDLSARAHVEREYDMYEEFPGPSPLDTRGGSRRRRNHVRGKGPVEFGIPATQGVGRLFPVSEELEGEGEEAVDMEFRVALGGSGRYGAMRGRRKDRNLSTFMGCDEVAVEEEEQDKPCVSHVSNQDALLDDDDGLEDPRDLDVELGFGSFDFRQPSAGSDFIVHGDEDQLFDEDEDDEDEFKFDMSAHLERPKIRPRVRTSSIFVRKEESAEVTTTSNSILCQPINFTTSTSPPKYSTLSKSAPSTFPPRRARSPPLPARRTKGPDVYRPELEIDVEVAREYDITGFARFGDMNSSTIDLKSPTKPLPSIPASVPSDLDSEASEEFTLAMDLPRAIGGLRGPPGPVGGKKKLKLSASASALVHSHSRPSLTSVFEDMQEVIST